MVGIDVRRMGLVAFALAGVLGGLAGVLVAPTNAVSFYSDLPLALSGFAAAVFGGLTSPLRTLVGGLGLGSRRPADRGLSQRVLPDRGGAAADAA